MRNRNCHGFTLIELIASITIIAILAAVAMPRVTAAQPFAERGYADVIAAALRQSRAVALASGCAVQFTVDAGGYRAFQHAAAGTHCAAAGAWNTRVIGDAGTVEALTPPGVTLAANRQFVFQSDGTVAGAPYNINLGPQTVTVTSRGLVQGP